MIPSLPWFGRTDESPGLPPKGSSVRVQVTGRRAEELIVSGAWRLEEAARVDLTREPLRTQVWIVAIDRASRLSWSGRPGGEAAVLGDEEPAEGLSEGWFHCRLADTLELPRGYHGTLDLVAVLGMERSEVASVDVPRERRG